jgi:arylsulfotransferase ASST
MSRAGWTRRQALTRAGAAMTGLAGLTGLAAACSSGSPAPTGHKRAQAGPRQPASGRAGEQHFFSRPDLTPPVVTMTRPGTSAASGQHLFLAPSPNGAGQGGAMILDPAGRLVWFAPSSKRTRYMDLQVQAYQGRPVLTWWQGEISAVGVGEGTAVVADTSYRPVHTIHAARGLRADLHEFVLTPQGTALITAYRATTTDLTAVGGPAHGDVFAGVIQEIDVASGKLLFEWDSLDHIHVSETNVTFAGASAAKPFDYFHINSIAVAPDGDLIISARNTWALYKIARPSGRVRWRLGGKKPSFQMGPGTDFYWQHDARPHGTGLISLFDDGAAPPKEKQSRALLLDVDTRAGRVTLKRAYTHPDQLRADAEGNAQVLPNGNVVVGWGTAAAFSEFSAAGGLLLDGKLPAGDETYRAFLQPWSARPAEPPAVAAHSRPGGAIVHASWNGATGVDGWTVYAGRSAASLAPAGSARRTGFETAIAVSHTGPYFTAQAHDASGAALARATPVRAHPA